MTKDQFEKPLDPEFPLHDDSLTVQGAPARHNEYGAIMAPIFLSTTYRLEDINQAGPYEYIRTQNPTRQKAEDAVARLDHADHALGFASGMAAIATVFEHFHPGTTSCLPPISTAARTGSSSTFWGPVRSIMTSSPT